MSIRSMTGFAQVKGQVNGQFGFTLSLKSVNHRFLDIHFRMPSDSDDLEMKLAGLGADIERLTTDEPGTEVRDLTGVVGD